MATQLTSGLPKTRLAEGQEFPNRLRLLRLKRNLTLKAVGDYLGVSAQAIREAELEGTGLRRRHWYKLADLFECDPRVLETPVKICLKNQDQA